MVETTSGLVLRTRPLTETSLIVHWLTADLGRLATVAKGARRPKSPFIGKLDLFYRADFSFARSQRSELHTLREVNLRETHEKLRQDIGMLQQAAYCATLIEQTTETETPMPVIFSLFGELLQQVIGEKAKPQNIFAFEWKLLGELGLQPDLQETKLSDGAKCLVGAFAGSEWGALGHLRLSAGQVAELRQFLHGFLIYHLGKIPKGRERAIMGG